MMDLSVEAKGRSGFRCATSRMNRRPVIRDVYREALRLARKIEHVELGAHARFQEIFAESMTLEAG